MKPLFFKRLGAYLFDFIIVTLIVSIITFKFNNNTDIMKKMNDLLVGVSNNEITMEEYSNEIIELNYEYQKSVVPTTMVNVIISIGYFIVFATLNKGKTLGKKIFKLKVVNKEGKTPSIWNMLGRSVFLYGIIWSIINIISVYVFDVKTFSYVSTIVNYISYGFVIVCMFMVMHKKDNKGLHDLIGGTSVIGEVK